MTLTLANKNIDSWVFAVIQLPLFIGLCWVRKIEQLAFTHIIAEIAIVITVITVLFFACAEWHATGAKLDEIAFFNTTTWYNGIGFSVYSYEGIGIIMPV